MTVAPPALLWLTLTLGAVGCRSAPARAGDRQDPGTRASVESLDCAEVRELSPVSFARGSASLDPGDPSGARARRRLDETLAVLGRCPAIAVRVFGYADASEGETAGLALSQARADAVRDYYRAGGLAADRVADASGRGVAPEARAATDTAGRPPGGARRVDTVPSTPDP